MSEFEPTQEEINRQIDEYKRQQAAAAAAKASMPVKKKAAATPKSEAQTAQPQRRERGLLTQVGEALDYVVGGDWMNDALDAVAPDVFKSTEELEQAKQARKQQVEKSGSPVDKLAFGTASNMEALASGMQAGLAMPMTVAARLANQDSDKWSNPPAIVKGSPIGEAIFSIAEIVTPTLLTGGVAAAAGAPAIATGGVALVGESAIETATQESAQDLVAGRFLAEKIGEVANAQGYDGAQLTRDLIEGKKPHAQAMVATIGLLQNMGINFGVDALVKHFGPKVIDVVKPETGKAAKILKKTPEELNKAADDVNLPLYDKMAEPHDVMDINSAVPVAKPSPGNQYINEDALIRESLRKSGIGEDGLTSADRDYFTNWAPLADEESTIRVLKEATDTLRKLKDFPEDLRNVMLRAQEWWNFNKELIDEDMEAVIHNFTRLTRVLPGKKEAKRVEVPSDVAFLREYAAVTQEGYIASALMGEELGVRIQKLARQAINLDNAEDPIDFTSTVENLLDLNDQIQPFLIPGRRGKRIWAVEGMIEQRKQIKRVKDADVQTAIQAQKTGITSSEAPAREFETIKVDDLDSGATIRELWELYKEGDEGAGATLKQYLTAVAYSEPTAILGQTVNLSKVLRENLRKGNSDAVSNVFYAAMLSRLGTHVASAASNVAQLFFEPMGASLSGKRAFGFGQYVGMMEAMNDAFTAAKRTMFDGAYINGGSKITNQVENLVKQRSQLEATYKGAQIEMARRGASEMEKFSAFIDYNLQKVGLSTAVSIPGRALGAMDEATKVLYGTSVAYGRAFQDAAQMGINREDKYFAKMIQDHMQKVFRDGVSTGKIRDLEVLEAAKNMTFQSDIPLNGNFVDNAFRQLKEAADESAFWRYVSPFTRVSYGVMEKVGRYDPTGVLRGMVPRYKAILNGEMGELAQIQLESQIAMGKLFAVSATTMAMLGGITGNNSGSLPPSSFILPDPTKPEGYVAFDYKKIEPMASILAVTADMVNGLRDDVITQGQYDRFIAGMVMSLGMATFDKTFQKGMMEVGSMLSPKMLASGGGFFSGVAGLGSTAVPGVVKMIADWAQPYRTISTADNDPGGNFWRSLAQRSIGGAGLPVMYDELTGKPIPKVATVGPDDNYWAAVTSSIFREALYPGKTARGIKDPIRVELDWLNYKHDQVSSLRRVGSVTLSPQQQSILSEDMYLVGGLRDALAEFFSRDTYQYKFKKDFQKLRTMDPMLSANKNSLADQLLDDMHGQIRSIYQQAKLRAATQGRLAKDPDFQQKLRQSQELDVMVRSGELEPGYSALDMTNR